MSDRDRHDAALKRLNVSRSRLRQLLLPAPDERTGGGAGAVDNAATAGWTTPRRWRAQWRLWSRRSSLSPLLQAAEYGLGRWWQRHPWRETATVIGELGAAKVRPLIRSHPLAAIGLGAAAGAALAWSQPWRWRPVRVRAARSTRQAMGWAFRQLSQPAVQMLLAGLLVSKVHSATPAAGAQPPV